MEPKSTKLKIIIADDHPVFRSGLEAALKTIQGISKIAHASNGEEVIKLLQSESYSLVFMDIKMAPMDGLKASEIIVKRFPKTKIIALSMYDEQEKVLAMLDIGANGYLLKNANKEEIEVAIKEISNGGSYYSQNIAKMLYTKLSTPLTSDANSEDVFRHDRYRDIIYLLYHELNSEEIAEAMFLSVRTIEDYRSKILNLTNSKNTIGILKLAIEKNLHNDVLLKKKFEKVLSKKLDQ